MHRTQILFFVIIILCLPAYSQNKYSKSSLFKSYKGLIMAGYQGWFNAPADGSNMGWNHYARHGRFEPGFCNIDFWPEVSEYKTTYTTPFSLADGRPASLFSCADSQTVATHFKWMKEYGLDGVFVQRSVVAIKDSLNLIHDNRVLKSALMESRRFGRAISVMYDFSGLNEENMDWQVIINDWKYLVDSLHIADRGNDQSYLYHNGKPLVGIWGVGFPDRPNDLKTTEKIIDFLKNDPVYGGCAVLLGVPTYWMDFGKDTEKDPYLHQLLLKVDIVRPWFVGRYNEETYKVFKTRIAADIAWCKRNKVDYAPVVFPGFSWHNMHPEKAMNQIPRNRGRFYWEQLTGALDEGAEMIYVAMFDEMDEGTAIFKMTTNPPLGVSKFEHFEGGIPPDYYLYLTGIAAKMLKKQIPFQNDIPLPRLQISQAGASH
ncbi:MAG TPA: glycoside hydrolase family 71/99-like protein [Puia sp.]|nr:glycoside hydrolase family 71/99-like protein [Puia sp.]